MVSFTARALLRFGLYVKPVSISLRKMSLQESSTRHFPNLKSSTPGEEFEVRQTSSTEDYTPDPSKSLPLSPARQSLVDDILALYSCKPTVERVRRYTPDCVYDDQLVYAVSSKRGWNCFLLADVV
jgi:hypothetical protein